MTRHALSPISLIVLLLAACGGGGGDDDPVTGGETIDPGEVPETIVEGTWETACLPETVEASGRRIVLSVQEGDPDLLFNFVDTTYGDAQCLEGDALRDIETRGTFDERLFETGQGPEDGIPIDIAVDAVVLRPRIRQVADTYNERLLCGSDDWTALVDRDVSGCDDGTGTLDVSTEAPRTDYNRYLVDDNGTPDVRADDRLLLGTLNAQTDPAARPLAVSQEVVFTRRPGTASRPDPFGGGL